jgi:hypothetical protein
MKTKTRIDGRAALEAWVLTGSTYKAALYLKEERGIFNQNTGNPVTPMGIWTSALRYMVIHTEEAWEYLSDKKLFPMKEEFLKYIIAHGNTSLPCKRAFRNLVFKYELIGLLSEAQKKLFRI